MAKQTRATNTTIEVQTSISANVTSGVPQGNVEVLKTSDVSIVY